MYTIFPHLLGTKANLHANKTYVLFYLKVNDEILSEEKYTSVVEHFSGLFRLWVQSPILGGGGGVGGLRT